MPKTKDPQAELDALVAAAAAKYGPTTLHRASDSLPINRVPFMEPQLNYATRGGMPFGRFASFTGQPMTGKSRVSLEIIAQAQQLPRSAEVTLIPRIAYHSALVDDASLDDGVRRKHQQVAQNLETELEWARSAFPNGADAIFYNAEAQFDPVFARSLGVDLDRLLIFESVTIEEIAEIMRDFFPHVPLHVIDSTTNTSSMYTQKEDAGAPNYGTGARKWKECILWSLNKWDREHNMCVMIHQLSTNNKTGGQQSTATNYMNFMSRLTLRFTHGAFLYSKDGVLKKDKADGLDKASMVGVAPADGREVFVKVEKNSTGRPNLVGGLQWSNREERFVAEHELASAAIYHGVVRQSGSWYSVDGESVGQGLKSVYARLLEDEELRTRVTCRLLDHVTDDG